MSLEDSLYRERPNSLLAVPIAIGVTAGWWDQPWSVGAWCIIGFFWLLAAACFVTDLFFFGE